MKIAMFVNEIAGENPKYTTTWLAREATVRGHEVWYIEVEGFAYDPDDMVRARARRAPDGEYETSEDYLAAVAGEDAIQDWIDVQALDVLMLRNDPSVSAAEHPWTQDVGVIFGQVAARQGVLVVNHPTGLARARNKLYFQFFPQEVRPKTLITREPARIREFIESLEGKAVLKPVQGSGGKNVFLVNGEVANVNQMIEAVARDGYVIAQEYLPAAAGGDIRMFLMNGRPLERDGHYAAMRRVNEKGDMRSNMHAGGRAVKAKIGEVELRLADLVRPKLIQDGMFLVGLDIAGDKIMEINVFSPGGLHSIEHLEKVTFCDLVIEALERKVHYAGLYRPRIGNRELAVL
ncbi:MAG TPA: glutathione synthetase [Thermoanaerobaculia bacterium]|nr:glutathione synthetase [Thermoanaerobaculia bacterium]